jgi:hypothetical protein
MIPLFALPPDSGPFYWFGADDLPLVAERAALLRLRYDR